MKLEELAAEPVRDAAAAAAAIQAFAALDDDDEDQHVVVGDGLFDLLDDELAEFSADELMAALSGLNDGDMEAAGLLVDHDAFDEALLFQDDFLEALPELAMDAHDDCDGLLAPIDDIEHVFDDFTQFRETKEADDDGSKASSTQDKVDRTSPTEQTIDDNDDDDDCEPINILHQLGKLTLDTNLDNVFDDAVRDDNNDDSNDDNDNRNDDDDWMTTCQPCTPVALQMQWKEENSRLAIEQTRLGVGPVTEQDIDDMIQHFAGALDLDQQLNPAELRQLQLLQQEQEHNDLQASAATNKPRELTVRPAAAEAAKAWRPAFAADDDDKPTVAASANKERLCLGGHRERILGLDLDETGRYMATASQDSNICIWDTRDNRLLQTLAHNPKFECLRVAWASSTWAEQVLTATDMRPKYLLATGTAEGVVKLFGANDPASDWKCLYTIEHADFDHFIPEDPDDVDDKPQIYSLQFIDHYKALPNSDDDALNSFLMTSSNDSIHFWELDAQKRSKVADEGASEQQLHLREVMSLRFTHLDGVGYGVRLCQVTGKAVLNSLPSAKSILAVETGCEQHGGDDAVPYGGHRNPHGIIFVFDASYCAANSLLGVALSDGSLRLVNGRGVCLSVLQLPGVQSHLTSFAWDASGTRLATSVATGHVITWTVQDVTIKNSGYEELNTSCLAVLQGGHEPGRPLFGVEFCGDKEDLLLSWGVDGRLCLWDAQSPEDSVSAPLATLVDRADYPIYAVDYHARAGLVAVGGGAEAGFIGIPAKLYDVAPVDPVASSSEQQQTTKTKSINDNKADGEEEGSDLKA